MANVKVILRESIPSLGEAGDVDHREARPRAQFPDPAGQGLARDREQRPRDRAPEARRGRSRGARAEAARPSRRCRLESLLLEVTANVGEEGKLFGSVTVAQIAELIAAKGIELDRRKIQLDEPIKEIGEHIVPVRLHKDVVANLKVRVPRSSDRSGRIMPRPAHRRGGAVAQRRNQGSGGRRKPGRRRPRSAARSRSREGRPLGAAARQPGDPLGAHRGEAGRLLPSLPPAALPGDARAPGRERAGRPAHALRLPEPPEEARRDRRRWSSWPSIADYEATAANVIHHARIVRDHSIKRSLIRVATEIVEAGYEQGDRADHMLDAAESRIFEISRAKSHVTFRSLHDEMNDALNYVESLMARGGAAHGRADRLPRPRPGHRRPPARRAGDHRGAAQHGEDGARAQHRAQRGRRSRQEGGDLLARDDQALARAAPARLGGARRSHALPARLRLRRRQRAAREGRRARSRARTSGSTTAA